MTDEPPPPVHINTQDIVLNYLRNGRATTKMIASHYGMTIAQTRRGLIEMELAGAVRASGFYWEVLL